MAPSAAPPSPHFTEAAVRECGSRASSGAWTGRAGDRARSGISDHGYGGMVQSNSAVDRIGSVC